MPSPVFTHEWDIAPREAVALQSRLASRIVLSDAGTPRWRLVAGVDVGLRRGVARAGVVVLSFPDLETVECIVAERPITFPYIPGLLSFREAPAILDGLSRLQSEPDVILFDGQGYAHPRRMGIATHVGILLDRPTVGCAKSRLYGTHEEPGPERGSYTPLRHDGEVIGAVVRTRTRVKPVFVSVGHRMTLERAVELVLACGAGYRLPEPTRQAHRVASQAGGAGADAPS